MDVVRQYVQNEVSISKQANVSQILGSVKLCIKVKWLHVITILIDLSKAE